MKILHVIPSIGLLRGGVSQAAIEMLQSLRNNGIDVELVTTNDNAGELLDVPLCQKIDYHQIPTWFFPRFSSHITALREFTFSWQLTLWLWQHISDYQIVHIHALFSYPSTIAMIIARCQNIPYINQPHGLLCNWALNHSKLKKKIYLSFIEKTNIKQSKMLHITSEKEFQEIQQLNLGVSCITIPLGINNSLPIDNARQKLREIFNIPENQTVILFLGRFHPVKGLNYLIPALSKVSNQEFTFILAGAGSPEYETEITELLSNNTLDHCTHRPGFVTGEMKNILLQGSDIFVITSYMESFSLVVLEAMAAGLATIVTPGVALASMIKENNVGYVPELDIEEISRVIQHCLDHPQEAREMGDRARQFILENYTWDQVALNMISVYKTIIQSYNL